MSDITSGTTTLAGITTIKQKRRTTQHGRYVYEQREIRTAFNWVQTLPWEVRFVNEIGRAK